MLALAPVIVWFLPTYPVAGSTTRSGIPVDTPWLTAGPSWSRMNTSSWQISVTKWRCSCRQAIRERPGNVPEQRQRRGGAYLSLVDAIEAVS